MFRFIDRFLHRLGAWIVQPAPPGDTIRGDRAVVDPIMGDFYGPTTDVEFDDVMPCAARREVSIGCAYICTLPEEHGGPHQARAAGPSRKVMHEWVGPDAVTTEAMDAPLFHDAEAAADARRAYELDQKRMKAWMRTIGATDPDTSLYAEALAQWQDARERAAAHESYREAPALVAEVEAFLASKAGRS